MLFTWPTPQLMTRLWARYCDHRQSSFPIHTYVTTRVIWFPVVRIFGQHLKVDSFYWVFLKLYRKSEILNHSCNWVSSNRNKQKEKIFGQVITASGLVQKGPSVAIACLKSKTWKQRKLVRCNLLMHKQFVIKV